MIQETKELLEQVKAKNMASDRQCVKCVCYVKKHKDKYNGEIRPSCSSNLGAYVSHNPARLCRWYKERKNGSN